MLPIGFYLCLVIVGVRLACTEVDSECKNLSTNASFGVGPLSVLSVPATGSVVY
jgi:hypothetical protein